MKLILIFGTIFLLSTSLFAQQNSIPTNGNVGLGTTNPNAKLDVKGRVKIDSTLVVKDSATFEKSMTVQQDMRIEGDSRFNNVDIIGYLNVSGTTKLGGNVQFTSLGAITDMTNKGMIITDAEGNLKKVPYDTMAYNLKSLVYAAPQPLDPCDFFAGSNPNWTSAPDRLYVACPEVKVGVGTSNPQTNLDIQGTAFTKRFALNTDPNQLGTKYFHMKVTETAPSYQNAQIFLIENNERALFQINNDGTARAREMRVNLDAAWPDYVFEPNYKLIPLNELSSFISINGHLPNIPSAEKVQEEGVSLGEMNRILVEKVEELTLYIIQQQKAIDEQQIRIQKLENQKN